VGWDCLKSWQLGLPERISRGLGLSEKLGDWDCLKGWGLGLSKWSCLGSARPETCTTGRRKPGRPKLVDQNLVDPSLVDPDLVDPKMVDPKLGRPKTACF
jgi:hypothetical protein